MSARMDLRPHRYEHDNVDFSSVIQSLIETMIKKRQIVIEIMNFKQFA